MIRLAGLVPGKDIVIDITGQRPGERLAERLSIDPLEQTGHEKVMVAQPSYPGQANMVVGLDRLRQSLEDGDESKIREQLLGMASTSWSVMESDLLIDLRDEQVVELTPSSGGDNAQSGN